MHGLVQAAYIDSITNLPNKQYMEQKIKGLLSKAIQNSTELSLGLLIVDVRNLAAFNEYGGFQLGNTLLKIVAKSLSETVEQETGSFVSRWYGSAFIVLINTNKVSILLNWADKLKYALAHSKVPNWDDIPIEARIYGTILKNGETLEKITVRLEKQLSICKETSDKINIF